MKRDEFEKNLNQLLGLLKKLLRSYPGGAQAANFLENKSQDKVNLNVCFFNFLPMSAEEIEELEEACSDALEQRGEESETTTSDFVWNKNDEDFLRQNGMTF